MSIDHMDDPEIKREIADGEAKNVRDGVSEFLYQNFKEHPEEVKSKIAEYQGHLAEIAKQYIEDAERDIWTQYQMVNMYYNLASDFPDQEDYFRDQLDELWGIINNATDENLKKRWRGKFEDEFGSFFQS